MRLRSLLCLAAGLAWGCAPRPKPTPGGDTVQVDTATAEPDSSAMWNYEDKDTIRRDSSQHAGVHYPLHLTGTTVVVDTAVDTLTASGYTWVTRTETRITTAIDTAVSVVAVDTIVRPPPPPPPPVTMGVPY